MPMSRTPVSTGFYTCSNYHNTGNSGSLCLTGDYSASLRRPRVPRVRVFLPRKYIPDNSNRSSFPRAASEELKRVYSLEKKPRKPSTRTLNRGFPQRVSNKRRATQLPRKLRLNPVRPGILRGSSVPRAPPNPRGREQQRLQSDQLPAIICKRAHKRQRRPSSARARVRLEKARPRNPLFRPEGN